ncbi:hypothetical protein [Streptacidiphilus sp. EB103A]|uniref:hypothetical protein n=1 Tax=Streptacidiphilus sp. EB103A TaxID=3156275 RepID=UPI003514A6D7
MPDDTPQPATFTGVLRFLADSATAEDLVRIEAAVNERRKRLDLARIASIAAKQLVRIDKTREMRFRGLTGTVLSVERTLMPTASVLLDAPSTARLRKLRHQIPAGATEFAVTMPLGCLYPVSPDAGK